MGAVYLLPYSSDAHYTLRSQFEGTLDMQMITFETQFEAAMPVGTVVNNAGRGTSTVVRYRSGSVTYRRGLSNFSVRLEDLHAAYLAHRGLRVTPSDLKAFKSGVFDSSARPSGHNCHCTFLFRGLQRMRLAGDLTGRGVSGNPFAVEIFPATKAA